MTKYKPVPKMSKFPPFGYERDPENDFQFLPIPDELDALYEGLELFKKGVPIRRVADWLSAETGRKITSTGLHNKYQKMKGDERRRLYASWVEENRRKFEEQHSEANNTD